MKKTVLSILVIITLFFTACDPNKDVYDKLDSYNKGLSYTLNLADYQAVSKIALTMAKTPNDMVLAKNIAIFNDFSSRFPADSLVPFVIAKNFPTYQFGSSIAITYNVNQGSFSFNKGVFVGTKYTMSSDDYLALAVNDTCFNTTYPYANYLPGFLLSKFTTPITNEYIKITYNTDYPYKKKTTSVYYMFNGTTWNTTTDAYTLLPADYLTMGNGAGQPGQFNNFSATAQPENYLPKFLLLKYPYAQVGDKYTIQYVFYSGSATTDFRKYEYDGTSWVLYSPGKPKVSQFYRAETNWIFDPTIFLTIAKPDYMILVDYALAHEHANYVLTENPAYGPKDYWYGSDPSYPEFQMTLTTRRTAKYDPAGTLTGKTNAEAMAILNDRVKEGLKIILETKYPTAQPIIAGVQIYCNISYIVYTGKSVVYTAKFKVSDVGKFTLETYVDVPTP